MRRSVHIAIAVVTVFGIPGVEPATAQESQGSGLRLSVVGIGAKDYAESLNFYTKVMGFRAAFSFTRMVRPLILISS
jgi:hypothetical protein